MTTLPQINALVSVAFADLPPSPSRVEDLPEDHVVVAAPSFAAAHAAPAPGEPVQVSWNIPRALMVLPTEFVRAARDGAPLWWLRVTGPAAREQRREFVRVAVHAPARLDLSEEGTRSSMSVTIQEISEGGARVALGSSEAPSTGLPQGSSVVLRFALGDRLVAVPASIRRSHAAPGQDFTETVSVEFTQPVRVADELRRWVFAQQLRERRQFR
jgi:c-di-GMP-binding flagellar brake protein YcgR